MRTIRVLPKARFDKHGARPRSGRLIVALALTLALSLVAIATGTTSSTENPGPLIGLGSHSAQFTLHTDPVVYMLENQH
ncbi:hypothetical protein RB25_13420 [Herbaspirillum rubrisubalbicans]|uniref:Transmembrane protein n=2 Tax=Herbaspirillum rubrisubalbicans TaxID=80842 RepID=A0ABX9C7P0_9BURK|nr:MULTISPECIES: hypothetical protein [Herbaspirillum]MCP1572964.1 hypothetical protein [Herbaspirillum rubrisubalbicans]NQE47292.1 hypothetical protein [Herbaspirillum rubrisubalbicans]QJQ01526.1 hypothetical protein C798_15145 [Herbaspirillum rubrisubalbicans Os34]RAM66753.1 hypothetical protein RB24_00115 [Herbaspirillum rubrisubalbicans]RAN47412.1 hypothetical protein RB25_13420 [Herbaspirillum rubrisubalbicans]